MHILIIMRQGYYKYADHIRALRNLGTYVHLITEVEKASEDGLLTSALIISANDSKETVITLARKLKQQYSIASVLTFLERDIILAAEIAETLGVSGFEKSPALVARDKSKQRALLVKHHIPSPRHYQITTIPNNPTEAPENFPCIVKPTQASLSIGVRLVHNFDEMRKSLLALQQFAAKNTAHYHEDQNPCFALIEEFLPGEEITLDGIVLDGQFILGGIHNKWRNMGPTFEEDLYSLPFKMSDQESHLAQIAASICQALKVKNCMFNVEMRQDKNGDFKVLEFSTRLSGAFCYRHIKEVYALDMVTLYAKQLLGLTITEREKTRLSPTMTTCTKWVFGTGKILKNSCGNACYSPYYQDYYPLAKPGTILRGLPHDIGCIGRLSLYAPYHSTADTLTLEQHAYEIIKDLEIELSLPALELKHEQN